MIKTEEEINGMRIAGQLAAKVLEMITPFVLPGVSTEELDQKCLVKGVPYFFKLIIKDIIQ